MTVKPTRRKFLRIIAIVLGILLVLLTAFHFWFKYHAKQMLEDLVESKSNGKLKMKVGKFKFGYFNKKMEMDNVVFYNTDTVNENTAYRFTVDKIKMRARGILSILLENRFLIDSLTLYQPDITVTRLKVADKDDKKDKREVSIPEEMGKVYNSIQDALSVLKVTRFRIDGGKFTLINKIQDNQRPLNISNINFQIENFLIDTGSSINRQKILFSDNVTLNSHNQDILLPDSRHRISFKNFNINLKKKLVVFDSCTIAANRTESSQSSFNVFFDKLSLTNIDFDTLYKAEVIKADSVYCVNPKFDLKVEIVKKKEGEKSPPKLENIIKQLTGDLLLAHVVVSNADINIETTKNGIPSSFTFTENNFEMEGLTVDQGAAKPIKVERFAMAIRNYENFLKDSTYNIKFDSILFKDDRISLSNFHFEKYINGKPINRFIIPQFYLGGLSWDDLVFENKLKAEQAILFNPDIHYTVNTAKQKKGQQSVFQALGVINEFMDLQFLNIVDGNIDLQIKKDLQLQLYKANLSVESNSLLASKKLAAIKNSLTDLKFKKGVLLSGDLVIELKELRYIGNSGFFEAASLQVNDKSKTIELLAEDVAIDKMIVDEKSGNIDAEGITWEKADVRLNIKKKDSSNYGANLNLKRISGQNTMLSLVNRSMNISALLKNISLSELIKNTGDKLLITGLSAEGNNFLLNDKSKIFSAESFAVHDNKNSGFKRLFYSDNTSTSDVEFTAPSLSLVPDVQSLLNGDFIARDVMVDKPVINFELKAGGKPDKSNLPLININNLQVSQPEIYFKQRSDSSSYSLKWNGNKDASNFLRLSSIRSNPENELVSIDRLGFYLTKSIFSGNSGKTFNTGKGNLEGEINDFRLSRQPGHSINWTAAISSLKAKDFQLDSVGKSNANIDILSADLNQLYISSSTINNLEKIISSNTKFSVNNFSGSYKDSITLFNWYNANFVRSNNNFILDSVSYRPAAEKDSFLARQDFQTDYITFKTGSVNISNFDLDNYVSNEIVNAEKIHIHDAYFSDYKDKNIPFNPGLIKPLPAGLLKKIPFNVAVNTIEIDNGKVDYTERSDKTGMAGHIPVTRMKLRFENLTNYNIKTSDTLFMEATGFLLDTAWAELKVKQSYSDDQSGFLLTFRLQPGDLKVVNPVLIPLASVKLESGFLDSLAVTVYGREAVAMGEIKMFYHDLKIKFLNNGEERKKKFLLGLKTFLANSFVVRKNNKSKTGQVFYLRKRDKSFINYYIKIIGSGVASSIGAKNNKKLIKKYQRESRNK